MGKGPAQRTPAQGVADMKARIKYFKQLKAKLLDRLEEISPKEKSTIKSFEKTLADTNRALAEAEARLKEYKILARGQN
jgi:flagellar biosynthesis chaperone FliJ